MWEFRRLLWSDCCNKAVRALLMPTQALQDNGGVVWAFTAHMTMPNGIRHNEHGDREDVEDAIESSLGLEVRMKLIP
jgi:hypothetical protein